MIDIDELEPYTYYRGHCVRGPHVMMWDNKYRMFAYLRHKFGGWMVDYMHHEHDPRRPYGIVGFEPVERIDVPR